MAKPEFKPPPPSVRRKATWIPCKCGQLVGVGLDDRTAALSVMVDPHRLSSLGEAKCLLAGWRTFDIQAGQINWRANWHIKGLPADRADVWVVREHVCYVPPPADWTQMPLESLLQGRRQPKAWPRCEGCHGELYLVQEGRTRCEACRLGIPRKPAADYVPPVTVVEVEEEELDAGV